MKLLKKLMACITALAVMVPILVSCDLSGTNGTQDSSKNIENAADVILDTTPYVATTVTIFTSDDPDMEDAIAGLRASEIVLSYDGTNTSVSLREAIGTATVDKLYTLVGDTLYASTTLVVGDNSATAKKQATVDSAARDMILTVTGSAMNLDCDDFTDRKTVSGDFTTVTCSNITPAALLSLEYIYSKDIEAAGAALEASNVIYSFTVNDGKYTEASITASFKVTMNGVEYTFDMTTCTSYAYPEEVVINAPVNANEYVVVTYDEIMK